MEKPVDTWTEHAQACARMAIALERKMRPVNPLDLDDIASIVRETLLQTSLAHPDWPPARLYRVVWRAAGWNLIRELDNARLPLAGADNLKRRLNTLRAERNRLINETGTEPDPVTLLESHNARQKARRKDADRQGALARPTDLAHLAGTLELDNPDTPETHAAAGNDHEWIDLVCDATRGLAQTGARFVEWWLETTARTGTQPTRTETRKQAERLGLESPDDLIAAVIMMLAERSGKPRPRLQTQQRLF